jgi:hypothetical protein
MLLAVLLSEVTLFNLRHWESINYKPTELSVTDTGDGLEYQENGVYKLTGEGEKYLEFENINQEMKNIYISISGNVTQKLLLVLEATDEGNKLYYELPGREVVSTVERSKYIKLDTYGVSEKLRINIEDNYVENINKTGTYITDNLSIKVDKIEINKPVPFYFNIIRVLILYTLLILLYLLRYNTRIFDYEINLDSYKQVLVLVVLIGINIAFAYFMYENNYLYFFWDRGVYTNLADCLLQGRFDLPMLRSDDKLAMMANPYDTNYRELLTGGSYGWDYAYYNGHYYVYFGIVPCLIMFLPMKVLFNWNIPVNLAMYVFTVIYILVGFRFVYSVSRKYFGKIPAAMYFIMAEVFMFCSALPPFLNRNDLYGIPNVTGLIFTMAGLDLWICSMDKENGTVSKAKLIMGSLCMALVAGCRPQLVLGSFFSLVIFKDYIIQRAKPIRVKKGDVLNIILFALPYIVVASFLMYYNYERFGSVTDFGAMYNLTTNDMTKRGFRPDRIPYGIYAYLFQPPELMETFPFFTDCPISTKYMGVTNYERIFGGALFIIPLNFIHLFAYTKNVRDKLKKNGMFLPVIMCQIFTLIVVVADVNMAGISNRYMTDYLWLLILSTFVIFMSIYKYADEEKRHKLRYMFSIFAFASMIINILLVFIRFTFMSMHSSNPYVYYSIMYAIEFWL